MPKYTTIIFDLDGTILNTLDDLADSMNHTLSVCGYPTHSKADICSFVGNGIRKLVERSVPTGCTAEETDLVHRTFVEYYADHSAIKTCPYPEVINMLKKLRDMGCKTAVVSNKGHFATVPLCEKYFPGLFDIAIGEREGIRRKPHPDSVLEVMKQLGSTPETTVYIGDSDVDIQTAKNSGIDCISVDWGFRDAEFLKNSGAEVIVSDCEALLCKII